MVCCRFVYFEVMMFFFKQKTAYEMRISDWSSDVCSSDRTTHIEYLFDFGSPNSYLVTRVIPEIEASEPVIFDHIPVLLGGIFKATGNRSPADAFAGIPAKLAYEELELQRYCRRHGKIGRAHGGTPGTKAHLV